MIEATASVRVSGGDGAQREAFRERVRWLLVRDQGAPDCEERHDAEALEYRFAVGTGIPFPVFVEASHAFAALRVEAQWPKHGKFGAGRVVFGSGMIVEKVDLP